MLSSSSWALLVLIFVRTVRSQAISSVTTQTESTIPSATILEGTVATETVPFPAPTNTQPCNGYVELCTRPYGDVTFVAAHNSPFVMESNAAANQNFEVVDQLNDGIRMLQGQTHDKNGVLHYCHTSCSLLDAGPVEDYMKTVVTWLEANPFEVITILIGNGDLLDVSRFSEPLERSGISQYAYIPQDNMLLQKDEWPTLGELILRGKRVIMFIDYKADVQKVPYLHDEFSYMWETPFSPTDNSFPCVVDRPPNDPDAIRKLYMANHNLNAELQLLGETVLIPDKPALNVTNSAEGFGSLGLAVENCVARWARPPNFLLVDFYDVGDGSVFEVAAEANNLPYENKCCAQKPSAAPPAFRVSSMVAIWVSLVMGTWCFI